MCAWEGISEQFVERPKIACRCWGRRVCRRRRWRCVCIRLTVCGVVIVVVDSVSSVEQGAGRMTGTDIAGDHRNVEWRVRILCLVDQTLGLAAAGCCVRLCGCLQRQLGRCPRGLLLHELIPFGHSAQAQRLVDQAGQQLGARLVWRTTFGLVKDNRDDDVDDNVTSHSSLVLRAHC